MTPNIIYNKHEKEILFKCNRGIYYLNDRRELFFSLHSLYNVQSDNIKHLDEVGVLYHYEDIEGVQYPVYYDTKNKFITKIKNEYTVLFNYNLKKNYTLTNLNLI